MDFTGRGTGRKLVHHVRRLIALAAVVAAAVLALAAPAQAQNTGAFETDAYLSIVRGTKLRWSLRADRLIDSLRSVYGFAYVADIGDSLDLAFTLSTGRKLHPGLVAANGAADGYVLTLASGIATWAAASGTAWDPDTADVLMTTGPRLLTTALLQPGTDGDLLMTAGGQATWVAAPASELSHVFWIGSSVDPHNAGDTASYKNVLYATVLHREYPIAHGNAYSALRVNIHIRGGEAIGGYVYNTYSTVLTSTGSGATAIVQGDKLLFRFFPKAGTSTDKPLRLYRVPTGTHVMGSGANAIYGQEIAYINIPAAKFPSSGTVSMEITFSYGVK